MFQLVREDLSAFSATEMLVAKRARQEARAPFSLAKGPLFRATLLKVAPGSHVLLVTMHHVISDGWSLGVLVHDLAALYDAFAHGKEVTLSPLPVQYGDYAAWQRTYLESASLEESLALWRASLDGTRPLELPADRPRPSLMSHEGSAVPFELSKTTLQGLEKVARAEGATLFMVLMAAYQVLMSRLSGETDVTVGTPVANRSQKSSSRSLASSSTRSHFAPISRMRRPSQRTFNV